MCKREADPEFDRRQRNPLLDHVIARVPLGNRGFSSGVIGGLGQRLDHVWQYEAAHGLAIGRLLHPALVVEVDLPDFERIAAQRMADVIHHPLDPHDPLRAAEPAKRRGAGRVGLQPMGGNPDMRNEIGVVSVQHRAVCHRQRQVGRPAAAHELVELDRDELALGRDARLVGDAEVVPLAGDRHVVVAVIAHLAGLAGQRCGHGTGDGERVALALLAAETAAHAPGFDPDRVEGKRQRLGHLVLDFGRMLGRGEKHHVPVVLRGGEADLAFEVEMLLTADLDLALDNPGRLGHRCRDITS